MSTLERPVTALGEEGDAPLVSTVIPSYNYAPFLRQAIESVLGQGYPNVEVLVVDDGSTDGSDEIAREYGDRIRFFQQANQGVSAARNRGIQESRGSLVAFLDADDWWHPEKLERQVPCFGDPAVGMVYSSIRYVDRDGTPVGEKTGGDSGRVLRDLALMRGPGVPATGSTPVVRRECFERVGLFDTALSTSADWDMWRRIACHYKIERVPEALVSYRLHAASMHRNVGRFESDMLHAFSDMFADPAAGEVHPLRRRCYGNLYATFAGSYLYNGQWRDCLRCAAQSVLSWPPCLAYLAGFPFRRIGRRLGLRRDNPEVV